MCFWMPLEKILASKAFNLSYNSHLNETIANRSATTKLASLNHLKNFVTTNLKDAC